MHSVPRVIVNVDLMISMYLEAAFLLFGVNPVLMNTVVAVKYLCALIQIALPILNYY